MNRVLRLSLAGLVALALAGGAALYVSGRAPVAAGAQAGGGLTVGGPFTLVGADGRNVSSAEFDGRWMLVYFGYTTCPDVCPTELQTMATALDKLGPLADRVAPLFITIDPERDTPSVVGAYVKLFGDRIEGLTGTPAQIDRVAREYRVYYAHSKPTAQGAYDVDHSSYIYLMNPQGHLISLFDPGTTASELAESIRSHLTRSS